MNTITNLNTFPIGNSLDGVNIITEEINTLSLLVDGTNSMLADLNMGNHIIKNMEAGVDSLDAVNKSQLDLKADTTYVNTQDNLRVLKTGDTMTGKLLLNYATPDIEIRGTQENQNSNLFLSTPYNNGTTKKTAIIASGITSYSRANLHFCLNQLADNTTSVSVSDSKMCIINSTGNVGIATTTPSEKLDVNGNGIVRGSLNMNTTNKIINVANGTNNLDVVNKSQLDLKADKTYVDNNFVNLTGTQTITGAKQFNNKIGLDALDLSPTFTEGANIDFDASQLKFKSKGDGIAFKCWSSTSTEPTDDVLVLNNSGYFGTPRTNGGLYLNGSSELWFNPSGSNSLYSKIFQNTSNNKLVFNSFDVTNGGIMSFNSGIGSDTFTEIFNINNSSMNVNKQLNVSSNKIINVANGTNNLDAINFSQLTDLRTYTDSSLNSLTSYVNTQDTALRTYTDSSLNLLRSYVNTQDTALRTYTDASLNLKVNKAGDTMTGQLKIIETTGTSTNTGGTLTLSHADVGGKSSLVFTSNINYGSDYGYIEYRDNYNTGNSENSALIIGIENDATGSTIEDKIYFKLNGADRIAISGDGKLGVNKLSPTEMLDVSGNINFTGKLMTSGNGGSEGKILVARDTGSPEWIENKHFYFSGMNTIIKDVNSGTKYTIYTSDTFTLNAYGILYCSSGGALTAIVDGTGTDTYYVYIELLNSSDTVLLTGYKLYFHSRNSYTYFPLSQIFLNNLYVSAGTYKLRISVDSNTDDKIAFGCSNIILTHVPYNSLNLVGASFVWS